MPGYVYARSLSAEEWEVTRWEFGRYPWATTSTLGRYVPSQLINSNSRTNTHLSSGRILGCHSHHSRNTHFIVQGRVRFYLNCDTNRIDRSNPECTIAVGSTRRHFDVQPGLNYLAIAGNEHSEARFVEGHEILSPTTRDRFLDRGDIVWSETRDHEGPVSQEVRIQGRVTREDHRGN